MAPRAADSAVEKSYQKQAAAGSPAHPVPTLLFCSGAEEDERDEKRVR